MQKKNNNTQFLRAEFEVNAVGAELRSMRKERDLTQEDIAEITGLSRDTVSRIESHTDNATFKTIQKYANAVGCKLQVGIFLK